MPLSPAWLTAGTNVLGGVTSALGAFRNMSQSRLIDRQAEANIGMMQQQHDLNKVFHKWELEHGPSLEMEGLRRAGVNPMLRYGQGGSGTPVVAGGSSALGVSIPGPYNPLEGVGNAIGNAASSAYAAARTVAETRSVVARLVPEIERVLADTSLTEAQRNTELQRPGLILQQTVLAEAQAQLPPEQLRVFAAQINNLNAGAFASMAAGYLSNQREITEVQETRRRSNEADILAVDAQRQATTWFHDQGIYDDTVIGFTLRALRSVSAAVQGR